MKSHEWKRMLVRHRMPCIIAWLVVSMASAASSLCVAQNNMNDRDTIYVPNDCGGIAMAVPTLDGVPNGYALQYYDDGSLLAVKPFHDGILSGLAISFYETGEKMAVAFYANNVVQGIEWRWWPNGVLQSYSSVCEGKLEGFQIVWDESGKLRLVYWNVRDQKEGWQYDFDVEGMFSNWYYYSGGHFTGRTIIWKPERHEMMLHEE